MKGMTWAKKEYQAYLGNEHSEESLVPLGKSCRLTYNDKLEKNYSIY